ncbi:PIN domain-containing protein [soil metagenome]
MATVTALYDANVLYPAPLRDLLMHLALTGLFQAKWSDQIHDEWMRNVLKNRPDLTREQLRRTRQLMDEHVRDGLVTGYEDIILTLDLPDPDDRHVLAAAIRGQADVIVTYNLNDFPKETLDTYGLEAQHPDEFITLLLRLDTGSVLEAVKNQRATLHNPSRTPEELLETYERQGLTKTVTQLNNFKTLL